MSSLKNKLLLNTFGLVYPFKYDFKCRFNTIAPRYLIIRVSSICIKEIFVKCHYF